MCGLFGVISAFPLTESTLLKCDSARDTLFHRGPDQAGNFCTENVYIGHRRLSILDLSECGRQPMVSDDGNVVITVNGEIYNFRALRKELESIGANFKSNSDSEVVLHGYICWGLELLLKKLEGMYAVVVFDRLRHSLFLARDRVGIKPLYYALTNNHFVWASELKAIKKYLGSELQLDGTSLWDALIYRYIPSPKSLYKNVYKLEPGSWLEVNSYEHARIKVKRYWSLGDTLENNKGHDLDYVAELKRAVNEQLVADVPVGLLLSGGIDSSVICALSTNSQDLESYCVTFSDEPDNSAVYARSVSDKFNLPFNEVNLDNHKMQRADVARKILNLHDEPFGDSSSIPTMNVCQFIAKDRKVALSGDGGDELFGGYIWYQLMPKFLKQMLSLSRVELPDINIGGKYSLRKNWNRAARTNDPILALYNARYFSQITYTSYQHWRYILDIPNDYDDMWFFRQYWRPELPLRTALQYLDFHTFLPEDCLTKVDRASMACSLEVRVPLLDSKVILSAFSKDEKIIYLNGESKGGFKEGFKELLPPQVLARKKRGFSMPNKKSFFSKLFSPEKSLQELMLEKLI